MFQVEMLPRDGDAAVRAAAGRLDQAAAAEASSVRGATSGGNSVAVLATPPAQPASSQSCAAGVRPLLCATTPGSATPFPLVQAHAVLVEEEMEGLQVAARIDAEAGDDGGYLGSGYSASQALGGAGYTGASYDASDGTAALGGAESERSLMAGVEWDPDAGRLAKALWLLEAPLSILRWATIPTDAEWDGRRRRWAVATPPLAAALLCVEVSGGVGEAAAQRAGSMPLLVLLPLLCAPLPYALWRLTRDDVAPRWYPALVGLSFLLSIVWLDLVATEVVALIETAGFLMGVSTSILGLTVIAIGNSAGDLVSDIAAARNGEAKMAVAACFGSPLLMNIIGAGAALTVRAITTGGSVTGSSVSQVCRIAYLFLYTALFSHMLVFPACGYTATRRYAVYLFSLYGVFMLLALLAEARLLDSFLCPDSAPCEELRLPMR